ncbi:MBL fold metallo-hydrolase [Methylophaga sulfidovorans]|uniref:Ribonuclease Z n=1 Tax=Methylophaga sulfidovorans TaxID=45496 RepID=A0A1I4AKU7_9GAMM|nr:MBL fold metallo-hydrolase [Methylophaga sulfidovorans]SFK57132.1 ribonuclease Z [Methylophaga sulfidovorans]
MTQLPLFVRLISLCLLLWSQASLAYMEVTLLGTGTPRPDAERFGPATLIEVKGRYFLFDAGRGTTIRLQQAGIALNKIDHVFFTHLHSDHISGFSDVWLTSWIWQRPKPISLIGPTGTNDFAQHLQKAYQADYSYRHKNTHLDTASFYLQSQDISHDQIVYDEDGITITAFLVDHYPVVPAFGYRIDYDEESIVISGDTTYADNVVKYAKGADLLIHEIAAADEGLLTRNPRLQKVLEYHTTPQQMSRLLQESKPRATVLTHVLLFGVEDETVIDQIKADYQGELRMGHDLMKIGVGKQINFR